MDEKQTFDRSCPVCSEKAFTGRVPFLSKQVNCANCGERLVFHNNTLPVMIFGTYCVAVSLDKYESNVYIGLISLALLFVGYILIKRRNILAIVPVGKKKAMLALHSLAFLVCSIGIILAVIKLGWYNAFFERNTSVWFIIYSAMVVQNEANQFGYLNFSKNEKVPGT